MKIKSLILVLILSCLPALAQNYTAVSGSNISDASGNKIASGQVCFTAVNATNQPITFQVGGGGLVISSEVCSAVTNGVVSMQVANPANTLPANILYRIDIIPRSVSGTYECTNAAFSGATFSLDTFVCPNVTVGPTGGTVLGPLTVNGNFTVTGTCTGCGSGGSAVNVNGTPVSSTTLLNFLNSAATNGLTLTVANPSAGNIQLGLSGTLTNAGLQNSSVTVNTSGPLSGGGALSLGASLTLTCATCVTSSGGGALSATAPITVSGAGLIAVNNATTSTVGVLELAGDLGGTGTSPTVVNGSHITNASVPNSGLVNSSLTVTAGTGLSGGGSVALGSSVTLSLANQLTAGSCTSCNLTFNAQGQLTVASNGSSGGNITVNGGSALAYAINFQNGTNTTVTNPSGSNIQYNVANAASSTLGVLELAGDLGGSATAPTVTNGSHITNASIPNSGLVNSSVTVSTTGPLSGGGALSLGGTLTLACSTCVTSSGGGAMTATAPITVSSAGLIAVNNATTSAVGVLELAGDLGGTGTAPTVTNGSHITNASIANSALANSSLTVSTGTGLSGGGSISLGGSLTLSLSTPVSTTNGGLGQAWGSSNGIPQLNAGTFSLYNSSCSGSTNALTWNNSTESFGCNTISGSGGGLSGQTALGVTLAATSTTSTSSTTPGTNQGTYVIGRVNTTQGTATAATEIQTGCEGRAISGGSTTDTALYSDVACVVRHDRAATAAVTETLPTPSSLNNTSFYYVYENDSAQTDTLSPTSFNVATFTGSSWITGTTASISAYTRCTISIDPFTASYWIAACLPLNPTPTQTIASGTAALGTSAISSGTCATAVTKTATGVATTDNIQADFNADPTSTTGFSPSSSGMLTIIKYPTSGNVNFKVCNNTSASITPGAVTLNWRVVR